MKKRVTTRELIERIDQRIDDLARATQVGFQDVDRRFTNLDTKLTIRIDTLTDKVQEIDTRLTSRIDTLTISVDGFARTHNRFDTELAATQGKYSRLEERVEKLEAR